jgi:hypothetical protein
MQKTNKPNRKRSFSNHGGKFLSLTTNTREGRNSYCAKVLRETPCYLTFSDVNSGRVITVSKRSII